MFRAKGIGFRALNRFKTRSFSGEPTATGSPSTKNNGGNSSDKAESSLTKYDETYRQLDNLDFATATNILFTEPSRKKKFGLDFHLVQFFFVLMPSFAVYLVAQYARYEMRKMEEELEQKKKKEEEAKAKELELQAKEEKEARFPELLEMKTRLNKLEEAVTEIVVESKKQSSSGVGKDQESGNNKKHIASTGEMSDGDGRSESSGSKEKDLSRPKSAQGQKDTDQGGSVSQDDKR